MAITARIVEGDFGGDLKLKKSSDTGKAPSLQKAKSVVDEHVSEALLSQAFEVIFKELERYNVMLQGFNGIDWSVYVNKRNAQRFSEDSNLTLKNEDNILIDEDSEGLDDEEEEEEEKPEENKDEPKSEDKKEEEKKEEAKDEEKPEEKNEETKDTDATEKPKDEEK